jgi:hypothetical protein
MTFNDKWNKFFREKSLTYNDEWNKFFRGKSFNHHSVHGQKFALPKKEFFKRRKALSHIKEGELDQLVADIIVMRWLAEKNFVVGGSHPLATATRSVTRGSMSNRCWARPKK